VQTLWCGNGNDGQLIQITSSEVRLVGKSHDPLDTWLPPQNATITVATGNSKQIALATNDGLLTYMEVLQGSLAIVDSLHVDFEISCLDMTPSGRIKMITFLRNNLSYAISLINCKVYLRA
jgi:hypothetical protein